MLFKMYILFSLGWKPDILITCWCLWYINTVIQMDIKWTKSTITPEQSYMWLAIPPIDYWYMLSNCHGISFAPKKKKKKELFDFKKKSILLSVKSDGFKPVSLPLIFSEVSDSFIYYTCVFQTSLPTCPTNIQTQHASNQSHHFLPNLYLLYVWHIG